MTKRKFYRGWIIFSMLSVVYFLAGQMYWLAKLRQIQHDKKSKVIIPSRAFSRAQLLDMRYQEVEADETFRLCGGAQHGWPTSSVQLRFDSGFTMSFDHLALDCCPATTNFGPDEHFRGQVHFWKGSIISISYGNGDKVYPINHNPYVGYNPAQDVFGFWLFQVVASMIYYSCFIAINKRTGRPQFES